MKEDMRRTSRARRAQQRKRRNRRIALTLCVMFVVLAASIGGTVAWLTDTTTPVTNTFTAGDINITLAETTGSDYKMVPGVDISKDPKVTVEKNSEDCYLFVKVEGLNDIPNFVEYSIADGWTALGIAYPGVYYRTVSNSTQDQPFDVIAGNKLTVPSTVTKAMLQDKGFELTFTAYAIQQTGMTDAVDAWTKVTA